MRAKLEGMELTLPLVKGSNWEALTVLTKLMFSRNSILAMEGIETRSHHVSKVARENIGRFGKLGRPLLSGLRKIAEISETLEPHVARTRYPWREGTKILRPEQYYTRAVAERFVKDARKALELSQKILSAYAGAGKAPR